MGLSRDFTGPRFHNESCAVTYKSGGSNFTGKTPATNRVYKTKDSFSFIKRGSFKELYLGTYKIMTGAGYKSLSARTSGAPLIRWVYEDVRNQMFNLKSFNISLSHC